MIGFCIVCPRLASRRREILTGFFGEKIIAAEISITRALRALQRRDYAANGLDRGEARAIWVESRIAVGEARGKGRAAL
jgi:hypothetical protein